MALYRSLELMPFVQPGDCPVRGCRTRAGDLQFWMMFNDPIQYRLLIRINIHEEDMFAVFHHLFKVAEVRVRYLNTKKAAFPDAEAKYNNGKEDKRYPACGGFGPAQPIGTAKDQRCEWHTNHCTNLARVNNILFHQRVDLVEMMFFNISHLFAEHMNLFGIDAVGFQFGFKGFEIVEIVTDVIVSVHA